MSKVKTSTRSERTSRGSPRKTAPESGVLPVAECQPGTNARSKLSDVYEDLINLAAEIDVAWLATHSDAIEVEQHLGGVLSRLGTRARELAERLDATLKSTNVPAAKFKVVS